MGSFYRSIGFRLLLMSFILLSFPLFVDSFIFLKSRLTWIEESLYQQWVSQGKNRAAKLLQYQEDKQTLLSTMIHFLDLQHTFPSASSTALNEKLEKLAWLNEFQGILLLKPASDGHFIAVASSVSTYQDQDVSWLIQPLEPLLQRQGGEYATSFVIDPSTHALILATVQRVYTPEGALAGLIVIIDDFSPGIHYWLREDEAGLPLQFGLLWSSSVIVAATDPSLQLHLLSPLSQAQQTRWDTSFPDWASVVQNSEPLQTHQTASMNLDFIWKNASWSSVSFPIPHTEMALLAYVAKRQVNSQIFREFGTMYGFWGALLLGGLAVTGLVTHRLWRPILHLSQVMNSVAQGHIEARYQKDWLGFEMNELGVFFNDLVEKMLQNKKAAEQERIQKELHAKTLEVGRFVQQKLLPHHIPTYHGVELGAGFIPAKQVGGDFCDLWVLPDGRLAMALADAAGKGVDACLYTLILKNILRGLTNGSQGMEKTLELANNLFAADSVNTGMFVTLMLTYYDSTTRKLQFYSCGHMPLLVYHAQEGRITSHNTPTPGLGFLPHPLPHPIGELLLEPGDLVILYSDGVTEAESRQHKFFGTTRLEHVILREAGQPVQEIVESVLEDIRIFSFQMAQHDDITLTIMRVQ